MLNAACCSFPAMGGYEPGAAGVYSDAESGQQVCPVQAVFDLAMLKYGLADHVTDSFLVLLGDIYYVEADPVA